MLETVQAVQGTSTVSYDPNVRPTLLSTPDRERRRAQELVALSDVVKASEEDMAWLYPNLSVGEAAARWADAGPALVVLTLGGRGSRLLWRHGSLDVTSVPVTVTDTVGAGDAFMSALLSVLLRAGLLGGAPTARDALAAATDSARPQPVLATAVSIATRAAAMTCVREGADPPTRAELGMPD